MPATPRPASLLLVLAAATYDGLLTLAILFVASAVAVAANGGEAIAAGSVAFRIWLGFAAVPYFAWCWTRGGQTLGMRAWSLRIQRLDAGRPSLQQALARLATALVSWAALGAGFAWMLVDHERMSWHDRLSGTRIVRVE